MNKTTPFKLNKSPNSVIILSLIFTILLVSSSITYIFAADGDTHTVIFTPGSKSSTPPRTFSNVREGMTLGELVPSNDPIRSPVPLPNSNSLFLYWMPRFDDSVKVMRDMVYEAQWLTDQSTSGIGQHEWNIILAGSNPFWKLPPGAQLLDFYGAAGNGHAYLDHAFLVIDIDITDPDDPVTTVYIYFLCITQGNGYGDYLNYLGEPGEMIASTSRGNKGDYSVWKVDITDNLSNIGDGETLSGLFSFRVKNNDSFSVGPVTLGFYNVRAVAYHYKYVIGDDLKTLEPFAITPVVGYLNEDVTATPFPFVPGYLYDAEASAPTASGRIEAGDTLVLKLYYKKVIETPLLSIRSALEGVEANWVYYDGLSHDLLEFLPPGTTLDDLFSLEVAPEISGPGHDWQFVGDVVRRNPSGTVVGDYEQVLEVASGYKILYRFDDKVIGSNPSEAFIFPTADLFEYNGEMYFDVTDFMDTPHAVNAIFRIVKVPLTITTGSASKPYDGVALTKYDGASVWGFVGAVADHTGVGAEPVKFFESTGVSNQFIVTLVNDEIIRFDIDGSQVDPEVSFNDHTIVWGNDDPSFTADLRNYEIVFEDIGTLDVYATVVYDPGLHGDWAVGAETYSHLHDGDAMPAFGSYDADTTLPKGEPGYVFAGWSIDGGVTRLLPEALPFMVTYTVTYVAQWEAIVYEIKYLNIDGVDNGDNPVEYTVEDLPLSIDDASKLGYTFLADTLRFSIISC